MYHSNELMVLQCVYEGKAKYKDFVAATGKSVGTCQDYVKHLVADGLLIREANIAAGLSITKAGREVLYGPTGRPNNRSKQGAAARSVARS